MNAQKTIRDFNIQELQSLSATEISYYERGLDMVRLPFDAKMKKIDFDTDLASVQRQELRCLVQKMDPLGAFSGLSRTEVVSCWDYCSRILDYDPYSLNESKKLLHCPSLLSESTYGSGNLGSFESSRSIATLGNDPYSVNESKKLPYCPPLISEATYVSDDLGSFEYSRSIATPSAACALEGFTKALSCRNEFYSNDPIGSDTADSILITCEDKDPHTLWLQSSRGALMRWLAMLGTQPRWALVNVPTCEVVWFYERLLRRSLPNTLLGSHFRMSIDWVPYVYHSVKLK